MLSIVTMSLSAAIWPQFATPVFQVFGGAVSTTVWGNGDPIYTTSYRKRDR